MMARPTNKEGLLEAAKTNFLRLNDLLDQMSEEERRATFAFEDRDRNVKDVLIHLYEWHMLCIKWLDINMHQMKCSFLPYPYNWKTYPKMNIEFVQKHQQTSYEEAYQMLQTSHNQVMSWIERLSQEELFTKKYYDWTGTTHIGSYCISVTSAHYEWAMKKLNKHMKTYREIQQGGRTL